MKRRKVLFVAMQHSIHVARWVELIADSGLDLHLFCVDQGDPNPNLRGVTLHMPRASPPPRGGLTRERVVQSVKRAFARIVGAAHARLDTPQNVASDVARGAQMIEFQLSRDLIGNTADADVGVPIGADRRAPWLHGPSVLNRVIDLVQPDLVHSMEFQHCGYLTLSAYEKAGSRFPGWLATNWGSDIYLFGRQTAHAERIRALLDAADLYSCECRRDLLLARDFGYDGPELPVLPNSGGFNLEHLDQLRSASPPSERKLIMIKGYHHFAGRAMTSLRVLERFAEQLKGFEIVLYSCSAEPRARALELKASGVLNIRVIDWATHDEILQHFGRARMYMGISLSDAISTSVLEAMAMGAFPIQTNTSCCDEWFTDGETGFIVDPDDFEGICDRFVRALTDNSLVDRAASKNLQAVEARLDDRVLRPQVEAFYDRAFAFLDTQRR